MKGGDGLFSLGGGERNTHGLLGHTGNVDSNMLIVGFNQKCRVGIHPSMVNHLFTKVIHLWRVGWPQSCKTRMNISNKLEKKHPPSLY